MKELKIGEEIRIRCVEDDYDEVKCDGCCFYDGEHYPVDCIGQCAADYRTDHKSVHFEIVEDIHNIK